MAIGTETRTDAQIQTDVLSELKYDARVLPNEIGVAVKDGVVTLTGWVDSFVQFPWANPKVTSGAGAEFVAADGEGNMYAGEPFLRTVRKYVRVRP